GTALDRDAGASSLPFPTNSSSGTGRCLPGTSSSALVLRRWAARYHLRRSRRARGSDLTLTNREGVGESPENMGRRCLNWPPAALRAQFRALPENCETCTTRVHSKVFQQVHAAALTKRAATLGQRQAQRRSPKSLGRMSAVGVSNRRRR